jgi:hypothetical protein
MKFEVIFLLFGLYKVQARSYGLRRDDVCSDVSSDILVLKDDEDSCGTYIACIGHIAQRFKCFSDKLYSNGTAICISCDENGEDFYEDDPYGENKSTRKKFTFKQTKRTKPTSKKYDRPPTRPSKVYATAEPPEVTEPDTTSKKVHSVERMFYYIEMTFMMTLHLENFCIF